MEIDDALLVTLSNDIASLGQAVRFIMESTQVNMIVPSALLGPDGKQHGTVINGPLRIFYEKAVKSGKHTLQSLRLEDFQDEISNARAGSVSGSSQGQPGVAGGAQQGLSKVAEAEGTQDWWR